MIRLQGFIGMGLGSPPRPRGDDPHFLRLDQVEPFPSPHTRG